MRDESKRVSSDRLQRFKGNKNKNKYILRSLKEIQDVEVNKKLYVGDWCLFRQDNSDTDLNNCYAGQSARVGCLVRSALSLLPGIILSFSGGYPQSGHPRWRASGIYYTGGYPWYNNI